jgi:hypothetical protein
MDWIHDPEDAVDIEWLGPGLHLEPLAGLTWKMSPALM